MDLEAIWHEWETGKKPEDTSDGYINPAAMDDWAADSIEARAALKAGAFE